MISVRCCRFRSTAEDSKSGGVDSNYLIYDFEVKVDGEDANCSCAYTVDRSYTSLVLLDKNLRRVFPNSSLPQLPLQDVSIPAAPIGSPSVPGGRSLSTSSTSSSSSSSTASAGGRVVDVDSYTLSSKVGVLTEYFASLLKVPEIIRSDLLYCFLDEESKDGRKFDLLTVNEACSSVDLLLSSKALTKKTVLKCHTVTLTAEPNQCVCWTFHTKKHDIGFSIDFNGKEGVKYERVNSHEKTIKGMFQVPAGAALKNEVKVFYDNSYSKLRAKDLRYTLGIFSNEEWNAAHEAANERNKAKKDYALHRLLVEDSLRELGTSITGQVHADLRGGSSGHSLTALLSTAKEKDELQRILDEKLSLMQAYEDTLLVLQNEKQTAAAALQELESAKSAKDVLEDELLAANAEIELFREKAEAAQINLQANQESLMEALGHSKSSEEVELMLTRALETRTEELNEARGDLEESRLAYSMLEKKLAQAVSERKQLKQYGKTAKVEMERLQAENKAQEVDLESTSKSLADANDKLAEAHEEILRLQGVCAGAASTQKIEALKTTTQEAAATAPVSGIETVLVGARSPTHGHGDGDGGGGGRRGPTHIGPNSEMDMAAEEEEAQLSRLSMDDGWQQMGGDPDDHDLRDSLSHTRPSTDSHYHSSYSGSGEQSPDKQVAESSNKGGDSNRGESFRDGKWVYVPPPKLTPATGFFGF